MGNYVKYFSHDNDIEEMEADIQSAIDETIPEGIHTPPTQKTIPVDPRSVTAGIDRTPIQVNCTPARINKRIISAIPKHLQMKPYLETDIDKIMCLSPVKDTPKLADTVKLEFTDVQKENVDDAISKKQISSIDKEHFKILGLDPRSPAADFDRTPILKPSSMRLLRTRHLQSLNKMGSYETDVYCSTISYCETSSQFDVPEIQVLPDLAACLMESSDLINVNSGSNLNEFDSLDSRQSSITERISNNEAIVVPNYDEACLENSNSNNVHVKKDKHEVTSVNNDIIKVWRDSLASNCSKEAELSESVDVPIVDESTSQLQKEEVIITFDDDNIAKDTLSLKMFKPQNDKQKTEINGKKTKLVKSEVKSLGDEKKMINSNDKNSGNETTKIRTPLGNRSNNGQIQTGTTKSPQQIFRSKNIVPKQLQENTPPRKSYVAKSKLGGIQWDPDSTVII